MRCPFCGEPLHGIPPLETEEWICDNPDCPHRGNELYGATQKEVNEHAGTRWRKLKVYGVTTTCKLLHVNQSI